MTKKVGGLSQLNELNTDFIVMDDVKLDPIEIIALYKRFSVSRKKIGEINPLVKGNDGKTRIIKFRTFESFGINSYAKSLKSKGCFKDSNVYYASGEELKDLFSLYVYKVEKRKKYLNSTVEFKKSLTVVQRDSELRRRVRSFFKKLYIRINYIVLEIFTTKHRLTNKFFIDNLKKNAIFENSGLALCDVVGGKSSSMFMKCVVENEELFVKGNELGYSGGIRNEIYGLNKVALGEENWYLPYKFYDVDRKWIAYPFVKDEILRKTVTMKETDKVDLRAFGKALVFFLDGLYDAKLLHGDLRVSNIFAVKNENGIYDRFYLADFGCSGDESRYSFPKGYWGRLYSLVSCGDERYSESIVDDAASAYLSYLTVGGKEDDKISAQIRQRIGRIFMDRDRGRIYVNER
ncbi:MAG: hypothetical protein K6F84_06800 [Lachnospiraceae bacterium]|nr:hypothetical protein [Lachnospiraceae bacterium]